MAKTSCCYRVDAFDKIVEVGEGWAAFAQENGAPTLGKYPPLGRSLWDFIQGISTRNIYYNIMKQVRQSGKAVHFPFHCDSPELIRYMEMEVQPGGEDSLTFRTSTVMNIEREPAEQDSTIPANQPIVQMCAWCGQVLVGAKWASLQHAIWVLGLLDAPEAPPISHGMCPECAQQIHTRFKTIPTAVP